MMIPGVPILTLLVFASPTPLLPPADTTALAKKLEDSYKLLMLGDCDEFREAVLLIAEVESAPEAAALRRRVELAEKWASQKLAARGCTSEGLIKESPPTKRGPAGKLLHHNLDGTHGGRTKRISTTAVRPAPATSREKAVPNSSPVLAKDPKDAIIDAYELARTTVSATEKECRTALQEDRPACLVLLHIARNFQADIALEAMRVLPDKDRLRAEIRTELIRLIVEGQSFGELGDALKKRIADGQVSAEEAEALFTDSRELVDLARKLSDAKGSPELWKRFLKAAAALPDTTVPREFESGPVDWPVVFAYLSKLSHESWRLLREEITGGGLWDPHLRRDETRLVYVYNHGLGREDVALFTDAFTPWIQAASPQGARAPFHTRDLGREEFAGLQRSAREAMTSSVTRECGPEIINPAENLPKDTLVAKVLCGSYYGLVFVEFYRPETDSSSEGTGNVAVSYSWIRRDQGTRLVESASATISPITIPLASAQQTVSIQKQVASGQKLGKQLALDKDLFPAAAKLSTKILETTPPTEFGGTSWHAFVFAGLPYLEDSKSSSVAAGVFSTLDVLTLGGGLAALGMSVRKRTQYSEGDAAALGQANSYLKLSEGLLIGALAVRSVAALCYWSTTCRRWMSR
jgi:hypothetical protein